LQTSRGCRLAIEAPDAPAPRQADSDKIRTNRIGRRMGLFLQSRPAYSFASTLAAIFGTSAMPSPMIYPPAGGAAAN
jgi:hypothetical protein